MSIAFRPGAESHETASVPSLLCACWLAGHLVPTATPFKCVPRMGPCRCAGHAARTSLGSSWTKPGWSMCAALQRTRARPPRSSMHPPAITSGAGKPAGARTWGMLRQRWLSTSPPYPRAAPPGLTAGPARTQPLPIMLLSHACTLQRERPPPLRSVDRAFHRLQRR